MILIGPEGAASVSGHMVGSFAPQDPNTDEFYADFGAMIGGRRQELGLSQDALAAKLSLTRSSVANLESGRQRTPLHIVVRLAWALQIHPVDLLPALDSATARF